MRRVVTANDWEGMSVVVADGTPPTTFTFGPNTVAQVWALEHGGTDWGAADPTIGLPLEMDLAPDASRWVMIEFGPGGGADMHVTETIDLGVVLEGEITLRLDRDAVVLRQGDVLVQQRTRHAWHNHGARPCRMLFHVVSSKVANPVT